MSCAIPTCGRKVRPSDLPGSRNRGQLSERQDAGDAEGLLPGRLPCCISLSSPTHPNFIVAASTSGVPGHLEEDSSDLYQVMQSIWEKLQKRWRSLILPDRLQPRCGQSAFIAKLDEDLMKRIGCSTSASVLLINPPVSLYNSVQVLDKMLVDTYPAVWTISMPSTRRLITALTDAMSMATTLNSTTSSSTRLSSTASRRATHRAALIAADFRISSQNMACVPAMC